MRVSRWDRKTSASPDCASKMTTVAAAAAAVLLHGRNGLGCARPRHLERGADRLDPSRC